MKGLTLQPEIFLTGTTAAGLSNTSPATAAAAVEPAFSSEESGKPTINNKRSLSLK
jgi:hypothetical protein